MAVPFRTSRRVEFVDTDVAGIAHFSNFFRWMESAEVEMLRSLGLSVKMVWQDEEFGFPRVAAACDYLRPVTFEDVLDITVRVERVGRKSVTYAFEFAKDGEAVARGKVTAVCVRMHADRSFASVELPAAVRARLEQGA